MRCKPKRIKSFYTNNDMKYRPRTYQIVSLHCKLFHYSSQFSAWIPRIFRTSMSCVYAMRANNAFCRLLFVCVRVCDFTCIQTQMLRWHWCFHSGIIIYFHGIDDMKPQKPFNFNSPPNAIHNHFSFASALKKNKTSIKWFRI